MTRVARLRYLMAPAVVISLLVVSPAAVEGADGGFETSVTVDITADPGVDSIVRSYVTRELRQLDGVTVSDEDAEYKLSVVVLKTSAGATRTGYAVSSVALRLLNLEFLRLSLFMAQCDETEIPKILIGKEAYGYVVHHSVQTGAPDDLEKICSELVAFFDGSALEQMRQLHEKAERVRREHSR